MNKKKIAIIVVGLISLLIIVFAIIKKPSTYSMLKNRWDYTQIINDSTINSNQSKFYLNLRDDFTFTHASKINDDFTAGVWRFDEDTLILTCNYTKSIDSVDYKIIDNVPSLIYYSNGKQISQTVNNKLSNTQFVKKYFVEECTANKLFLKTKNQRLEFKKAELTTIADTESKFDFSLTAILRGFLGLLTIIGIAYLFSSNRKAINWKVVGIGLGIQILLAIGILKVPAIAWIFETVGKMFVVVLDFTKEGSVFLLGDLMNPSTIGFVFAFQVLPTIIFFSALTSLLFYLGIIQKIVYGLAWLLTKILRLSGAESLSVAGNIFLGQTESPLMIKAYLEKMNKSEIMLVMSGGMATLAGGVLASYIAFLGGSDPVQRLYFAKHLIAASVMAAPGVIVLSKILVPQTQGINKNIEITKEKIGSNVLDAISNGTTEGLKLAANVGAMLLSFIAFIAMFNFILMKIGSWTGLNEVVHSFDPQYDGLNLKFILGYIFAPIVWLMGVAKEDITLVGRLLGEKLIATEFIAYISLADLKSVGNTALGMFSDKKSIIMSTYALAGFANFASIGIQIGGIGTLAPGKRKQLSELGIRALIAGSLASMLSATIVGMLYSN